MLEPGGPDFDRSVNPISTRIDYVRHINSCPPTSCGSKNFLFAYFDTLIKNSKVVNIFKGSLDLIPSPSPSVKIQIMGGKVCLRCKGKTNF